MKTLTRRTLLGGLAGIAALPVVPEWAQALAGARSAADWRVAFADLESDVPATRLDCISGKVPRDLSGTLYRNGPAKWHRAGRSAAHWFDGDGLMRAFSLSGGQASLSARFVDTPKRHADQAAGAVVSGGFGTASAEHAVLGSSDDVNAANISVVIRGDELWALWEGASPVALDPRTLETRGIKTLRDDLAHLPFLAHPRIEPNGELWNLGQSGSQAVVWRVAPDGGLLAATPFMLPRASYIHDFTATDRHLIILLQPWVQRDAEFRLPVTGMLEWHPEWSTQILVLDKSDLTRQTVYELPAFFFFHLGSAWREPGGAIHFDVCRYDDPMGVVQLGRDVLNGIHGVDPTPTLTLVTLSPGGQASMRDTRIAAEFPRNDHRLSGMPRSCTVHAGAKAAGTPLFTAVAIHDWRNGRSQQFDFGVEHVVEEMIFVPRPGGGAEMDGWLIGPSVNLRAGRTELHAFDARHLADGPICTWQAPLALPVSLHGAFLQS